MLDNRKSEEADGERRMIGSGRRVGAFGLSAREGLELMFDDPWGFFWMNGTASLRTWEKSCEICQSMPGDIATHATHCRLDTSQNGVAVTHLALSVVDDGQSGIQRSASSSARRSRRSSLGRACASTFFALLVASQRLDMLTFFTSAFQPGKQV